MTAEAAERARGIGDPFGPVTMRLLRMVRRELDVYDRNRERLFELKDPIMRAHIHRTLLRTMMGVEGTIESANEAAELEDEILSSPDMAPQRLEVLTRRMEDQKERRNLSFDFLNEMSQSAVDLAKKLEPIARVDFDTLLKAAREE
jgi:hypothetical protein